jgi:deoxyribose-phosphate aldolase
MTPDEQTALVERVYRQLAAASGLALAPPPAPGPPPAAPALVAGLFDHTLLKPEATPTQIEHLCDEARRYQFASVCVNPLYVAQSVRLLAGSDVAVCSVIGFPLGATSSAVKVYEAQQVLDEGAHELDMVLMVGLLKAGNYADVLGDIQQIVAACRARGALCKVILETVLLDDAEKVAACLLAAHAGADFVKTSTGFAAGGATTHDVALMRRAVGPDVGVKASGGIRSAAAARALLAAGATRIGASASVTLLAEAAA